MPSNITYEKNPDYVARGLKASIHNENVSDEAKANAAERLQEMGAEVPDDFGTLRGGRGGVSDHVHDEGVDRQHANSQRGYKAALSNDNVSQEAKEHAQQMLDPQDDDKNENRVLGGYKAALKNPNVSDEAKQHAVEVLKEHQAYD